MTTFWSFYLGGACVALIQTVSQNIRDKWEMFPSGSGAIRFGSALGRILVALLCVVIWPAYEVWHLVRASLGKSASDRQEILEASMKWYSVHRTYAAGLDVSISDLKSAGQHLYDTIRLRTKFADDFMKKYVEQKPKP